MTTQEEAVSDISNKVGGIAVAVVTSAIIGGFVWVQEIGTRVAIVEDDLGEAVDVISLLHPPSSSAQLAVEQEAVFTGTTRSKLEQLKKQAKGDDDDSSSGDDDDSAVTPKQEA